MKRDQADFDGVTETLGRKTSCKLDEKQWIETKCQEAKHAAAKNDFAIPQKIFEANSIFFLFEIAHYSKRLISTAFCLY